MIFYSPLRYPGGKNKLSKFIAKICIDNNIKGHYVEPYAGGAAVALYLLINNCVSRVTINDIDRSIFAFWYAILNYTEEFCNLITKTEINVDNWKKYRDIQNNKDSATLFDLGFSTFFLNRTNISGIINGGIIGGVNQKGKYKIGCRFNKEKLIVRIKEIEKYKDRIEICNLDAIDLIKKTSKKSQNSQTIFYFDPPYYLKGASLYLNHYSHNDHEKLSNEIKKIKNLRWIISYDNTPEIKKFYQGYHKIEYSFFHTAYEIRNGQEILFFSNNLLESKVLQPTKI
jgi:DNA adenine methylase